MLKKLTEIFLILFSLASCELTKSLWKDAYNEEIRQFLISEDGRYVALLGAKYHYVFSDESGAIKKLIELDRDHVVEFDPETTHLFLDKKNRIEGDIGIKTYDLEISANEMNVLKNLGFHKSEKENLYELELELKGQRYLSTDDINAYFSLLEDKYYIEIHNSPTVLGEIKKAVLTPITITGDTLLLLKEIALAPFGE